VDHSCNPWRAAVIVTIQVVLETFTGQLAYSEQREENRLVCF